MLIQNLGGQAKSIMVFSKVAYRHFLMNEFDFRRQCVLVKSIIPERKI